ncbi:MAG: twin-arginine translocation signal domain-containing protein, partial [Sedimenticolaceae bacterium]
MPKIDRRDFLKVMGLGAAVTAVPMLSSKAFSGPKMPDGFYDLPMKGNVRLLHITDVHGQLKPVYFREPNVNLGVGDAFGRPPHLVGSKMLDAMGLKPNTPESYAYTYLDFTDAAMKYGRTGGFAHVKA